MKLLNHFLRKYALLLAGYHKPAPAPPLPTEPVTITCISDTHDTEPPLPLGDILLHAGDFSAWGTFPEIQAQLKWLASQPHKHKVIVAGNHDLLLDPELEGNHPQRRQQALEAAGCTDKEDEMLQNAKDLDWGDVKMLCNQSLKLCFGDRELSNYGSPYTPQHGLSAFQYHRDEDIWKNRVPRNTDIILTHGPARSHLDGWKKSGCSFLQKEIMRVRPGLVVCGHIHVGYGKEERTYDRADVRQRRRSSRGHRRIMGRLG